MVAAVPARSLVGYTREPTRDNLLTDWSFLILGTATATPSTAPKKKDGRGRPRKVPGKCSSSSYMLARVLTSSCLIFR